MYKDRKGSILTGEATPSGLLSLLYNSVILRPLLKFMTSYTHAEIARFFLTRRISSLLIDPFIKHNGISLKEYIPTRYKSFNDFFTRMIRPEARPVDMREDILISPCDAKAFAYRITDNFIVNIKNTDYSVKSLIHNSELAESFSGGLCMVFRLTADNFHRYSYIDSGYKSDNIYIPGLLHTVSPASEGHAHVYSENSREYCVLDTDHFGCVVQIEVGALNIGRIINWDNKGFFKKGDEKGLFEFGGSTIVLLLRQDSFTPDEDIVCNTSDGYETLVKVGERIGCNEKYKG